MPNQWTDTDDALVGVYLRCESATGDPATDPQAWMDDVAWPTRAADAEAEVRHLKEENARVRGFALVAVLLWALVVAYWMGRG